MTTQAPEPPPYADLIEYMAKQIVRNPDAVTVTEELDGDRVVVRLQVQEDDMGRVIGRGGRVAQAMRALLKAAAVHSGEHVALEIG